MFFPTGKDWIGKNGSVRIPVECERANEDDVAVEGAGGRADPLENLSSVPVGLRIIEFLKENGYSTQGEIAETLDVPVTTVSYNLRNLVEEDKVVHDGEKRGGKYRLTD